MIVHRIEGEEWRRIADVAHKAVFGEAKPTAVDHRIEFALLACNERDEILSYVTCREVDVGKLYWGYGGSVPPVRETVQSWRVMNEMLRVCRLDGYTQISFLVENTNRAMLKLALKAGFLITGLRLISGSVMIEHVLQLSKEVS